MTSKTFNKEVSVEFTVDLYEFDDASIVDAIYDRGLEDRFESTEVGLHTCSDEQLLQELDDRNQFYFDTVEMEFVLQKLYQLRRNGKDVLPLLDSFLADALGRII